MVTGLVSKHATGPNQNKEKKRKMKKMKEISID